MHARLSLIQNAPPAPAPANLLPTGGLVGSNAPPLQLPGEHFAAAMTFYVLGAIGLAWVAPDLASGAFLVPRVAAVVHLFTLGFIATSIFGALYQFLPIAVGVPIRSQRAAHVSFALLVLGIPTFVTALAAPMPAVVPVGAGAVALAFAIFATNLVLTLAMATERGVTWWALAASSVFLVATFGFGLTLAIQLATGLAAAARFDLLVVHVHVAAIGWVMLVMVGVGNRLLPMFMLSHGASERPARVAVACLSIGCVLLALPFGGVVRAVAAVVIGAGVIAFLTQAVAFRRHRTKKTLDDGMRLALTGLGGIAVALVLAPFALTRGFHDVRLLTAYVLVLIVGGISLFVAGHYFKIVPFLVWYHRFGDRVGKARVPRVIDLYSARMARAAFVALAAGVAVTAAGVLAGSTALVRAGSIVFLTGVLIEAREMVRIARRSPA